MAASSYEIIKQGDTKRIFYSAKNFATGKTVTATPYNPSNVAQTPISFTEISTSGIYYADVDSTGFVLGVWMYKVTENSSPKAFIKVQIVDGATLNDTAFEILDTNLDTALTNQSNIESKVDIIDGIVDDILVDTGTTLPATLATIDSNISTLQASVSGLSNNADAKIALVDMMLIPASGNTDYKLFLRLYDADGNMEDADIYGGYQEAGLTGKTGATATGLADSLQYYFKVNADGGGITEYSITTDGTAGVDFDEMIGLMNTATTGVATWSIVGGDLRCTSDTTGASSSISLSAGTTGTDLFATLTGFTAFDTAVAGSDTAMVNISVENSAGTDRSGNLTGLDSSLLEGKDWMTRVSQGVYSAVYNVESTDVVENLIFSFDILEATVPKSFGAQSRTASSASDYTSRFDTIDTNIATVDSNVDQLLLDVAENQTDLDTIITNVGTVDTVVDAIKLVTDALPDSGALTSIAKEATLGSPAGASMSADIAAIKTVVDAINLETDSGGIAI